MKKIKSKQRNVMFLFCKSPITIDKSEDWGDGNVQDFPKGAFLKVDGTSFISHGVQPKEDNSAPVGWQQQEGGLFCKDPIWLGDKVLKGTYVTLDTLDGIMTYFANEDSHLCYNGDERPNIKDVWVQKDSVLKDNYFMEI